MPLAADVAFTIHFEAPRSNHLGVERQISTRQSNAIKLDFHEPFTDEMPRLLVGLEMSDEIGSARKRLLTELSESAKMTEDRVADRGRGRRKIGFVQSALQECAGGHDNVARAGAQGQT